MTKTVAIIGAGTIGQGWAVAFARAGIDVRLFDEFAPSNSILGGINSRLERFADLSDPARACAHVSVCSTLAAALESADYVQECLPESGAVKRDMFRRLDELVEPSVILASSTSSLTPETFTEGLAGSRRCLIAHPFNPPYLLPIVEIVPAASTDRSVVARTLALMRDIGQEPILVNAPRAGLLLNRLQAAVLNEAMSLVRDQVVSPADLDRAMRSGLALRWVLMGPFETADLNAQGFADYAQKFAAHYAEIGRNLDVAGVWHTRAIHAVETWRRQQIPIESLGQRREWRDRMLLELRQMLAAECLPEGGARQAGR